MQRTRIAWIGLWLLAGSAMAREEAVAEKCVNDHANLIGKADREEIRRLCVRSDKEGAPIKVVTVSTLEEAQSRSSRLDLFADELFDEWEIEYEASRQAVMLLIVVGERQLRIRMGEVYSETDWKTAEQILRRVIAPNLGRRPSAGINKGMRRLYDDVVVPQIKKRKRQDFVESQKRGIVDFDAP